MKWFVFKNIGGAAREDGGEILVLEPDLFADGFFSSLNLITGSRNACDRCQTLLLENSVLKWRSVLLVYLVFAVMIRTQVKDDDMR